MNLLVGVLRFLANLNRNGLGAPIVLLVMLGMLIVPLSPLTLDLMFAFNISLSLVVALVVVYALRPLDFTAFPTVLLIATMLRLSLNVASTRVVLVEGHTGTAAAGSVIESFGDFVVGGNFAVGLIVFAILVIINFVVVTKGAGRVSEVSARFTLDSMPGKQMAIDADLNAGMLTQEQAKMRREEIAREADFYGAMDGASKFVRGDAIAGILILFINIVGGLSIGMFQHGLGFSEAMHNYTLLTVGDGLVAQIPSLVLSTATAIIVTRASAKQDMGEQVFAQMFKDPRALSVTAATLLLLGLIPGMPNVAFLLMAAACGAFALFSKTRAREQQEETEVVEEPTSPTDGELSWEDVKPVDAIDLEVGYRLVPLADRNQGGQLMGRIKGVRRKLSQELGFLIPPVHIRDNLALPQTDYRISVFGVPEAQAEIRPEQELAISSGAVSGTLSGAATQDPAFGMDAVWIEPAQKEHAQTLGYTVVDPTTVIATHLSKLIETHAHELLGHEQAQRMLDALGSNEPKLVDELVPKTIPMSILVKVLRNLLAEGIPVRDIHTIAATLAEHAATRQDAESLTAAVRVALRRMITQRIGGTNGELGVITLDPSLEQLLDNALQNSPDGTLTIEPTLADRLQRSLLDTVARQEVSGEPSILLVPPQLRAWLARVLRPASTSLHVLAYNEIPETRKLRITASIGGEKTAPSLEAPVA